MKALLSFRAVVGISVLFLFFACQSDEQPTPDPPVSTIPKMCDDPVIQFQPVVDTCFDLPFGITGQIIGLQDNPYWYRNPDFNPANPNELVYQFIEETPDEALPYHTEVRKVNICDGVTSVLADEYMGSSHRRCDYGPDDWIVFDGRLDLTIVESNGDSLIKIRDACGKGPFWIWEGMAILCPEYSNDTPFSTIVDKTGTTLDTLPKVEIGAYRDGKIIRVSRANSTQGGYFVFDIYDLETKSISLVADFWPSVGIENILVVKWLNNTEVIFSSTTGIYTLDVNTGEFTTIKQENCQNMVFGSLSTSPLENGDILVSRFEYRYTSPDSIKLFQRISLLNIYTLEEYVLGLE
jgi:hypothetical protein